MGLRRALSDWFQSLYFERGRLTSPQDPPIIDNWYRSWPTTNHRL